MKDPAETSSGKESKFLNKGNLVNPGLKSSFLLKYVK